MKSSQVLALSLGVLMLGLSAAPSFANPRDMNHREEVMQRERIQQGLRNGSLTKGEVEKIRNNQQAIQKYERAARADGNISSRQAQKINRLEADRNKEIYREEHDKQHR